MVRFEPMRRGTAPRKETRQAKPQRQVVPQVGGAQALEQLPLDFSLIASSSFDPET
jgi:hypothetical protein